MADILFAIWHAYGGMWIGNVFGSYVMPNNMIDDNTLFGTIGLILGSIYGVTHKTIVELIRDRYIGN
jgi:hypothetical protein